MTVFNTFTYFAFPKGLGRKQAAKAAG